MQIENVGLKFSKALTPLKRVTKIIIHHPAHPTWGIKKIHNYHQKSNGWNGIGYSYFIPKHGGVQLGRGGNLGAHCKGMGMNNQSLGICFQGDFDKQVPTEAQYRDGAKLVAQLLRQEGLQINDVAPHRDFDATACPGKNFNMNKLKQYILEEMNPNVKGVVQTMSEQVKVSIATQNAIDHLASYGIIQKDYKVTKDFEITLISMMNGLVNAIENGKLKVKQ
ncbi:peptidoglycan recognition protein family protein [Metabacillus fastidiosus]|nr:peptidoglycan recognition family protein [Metabacillus fastidiosus]MED4461707.1 peptidoglycan recognition family protein [Metabacillus fastidiosus]